MIRLVAPPNTHLEAFVGTLLFEVEDHGCPIAGEFAGVPFIVYPGQDSDCVVNTYHVERKRLLGDKFDTMMATDGIYHPTRLEFFTAHALAGLCANPHFSNEMPDKVCKAAITLAISTTAQLEIQAHVQKTT